MTEVQRKIADLKSEKRDLKGKRDAKTNSAAERVFLDGCIAAIDNLLAALISDQGKLPPYI